MPTGLKSLGVGMIGDVGGERGEAVTIVSVVVSVRLVPSPCLNDAPHITTVIDLLPQIGHKGIL
jgi:hypothetical protein